MTSKSENVYTSDRHKQAYARIVPLGMEVSEPHLGVETIKLIGEAAKNSRIYSGPYESPRRTIYKKQNTAVVSEVRLKTMISVLKEDAVKNSKVMGVSVCIFTAIGSIGWAGGPVGGAAGMGAGAAVGLGVGGAIIKHKLNKRINLVIVSSEHYTLWRASAIERNVYPVFRNFIEDGGFREFFCPLYLDVCRVPVKAPDGRTYDQETIFAYITHQKKEADEYVDSPIRGTKFRKKDLQVDLDYCRRLIFKASQVYRDVLRYGRDNVRAHGVMAVRKNTKDLMEGIRKELASNLYLKYEEDVRSKKMTSEERDALIAKETKQWDFRAPVH